MRLRRVLRSSSGAVSPVLSTILLVNIAMAAGVLYFSWSQSSLTKAYSVMQIMYQNNIDKSEEGLVIEDARYNPNNNYKFNVTIRNIGAIDSQITALYINGTNLLSSSYLAGSEPFNPSSNSYHILVSSRVKFMFGDTTHTLPITLHINSVERIIVVTERGTSAALTWQASP